MNQSKELILAPAISTTPDTAAMLPDAETIKKDLMLRAEQIVITRDSTTEVRDQAIALSGEMEKHLKKVEADREGIGKRFYDIWKAINKMAKDHSDPLVVVQRRLNLGIGGVNDRLAKEHLAEQERLHNIQIKAEQERQAAIDQQNELQLAPAAKTKKGAAVQLAKDLAAQELIEAAEEKQRKADNDRLALAEQARQLKPQTGAGAQRTEIEVEVSDINALHKAQPTCVKLEADMVQLKWLYRNRKDLLPLPGVSFTERPVFSSRAK